VTTGKPQQSRELLAPSTENFNMLDPQKAKALFEDLSSRGFRALQSLVEALVENTSGVTER
jgi:hypothetical protein